MLPVILSIRLERGWRALYFFYFKSFQRAGWEHNPSSSPRCSVLKQRAPLEASGCPFPCRNWN